MSRRVSASTSAELRKSWIARVDVNAFSTNGKLIFCNPCQCNLQIKNCTNLQHHARSSKHRNNVAKQEEQEPVSDSDSWNNSRNSDLENRESYLDSNVTGAKVKTEPISPSCANCNASLEEESAEIYTDLQFDSESAEYSHLTSKLEKSVTILDALKMIFDFKVYSDEEDTTKERLVLCGTCGKHLADLYILFCEFKYLCHEESFIKNSSRRHQDSCLTDEPSVRPQRRITILQNEEKSRKARMKALKKRQRLKLKSQRFRVSAESEVKSEHESAQENTTDSNSRYDNEIDQDEHFENPHSILGLEYSDAENSPQPKTPDPCSDSETYKTPRRGRGRRRKANQGSVSKCSAVPKRPRGRPRKVLPYISASETPVVQPRARGRPRQENRIKKRYYGLKEYKCNLCGKVSKSSGNHMLHVRGVHEGMIRYKYKCATCGKYFTSKQILLNHIRVIHDQESNKFICPEPGCGKTFAYQAGLYNHKFVHSGEMKFSCDVCHKMFRRGCDMTTHRVSHMSERPYICEHCGNTFKTRQNLNKHRVIHDENGRFKGQPPPTCTTCGKTFLRSANLRIHIRTIHEKQLPFKCPLCGKSFSGASNLKVHLHGFHKCPKDDNNKIVLPKTLPPASTDETWMSDEVRTNPVPGPSREEDNETEPRDLNPDHSENHGMSPSRQSLGHGLFPGFVHRPTASKPEMKNSFTRDLSSFFGYNT